MKHRRIWLKIVARLFIGIVLILVAGAAYNALSLASYRRAAGVPGKLYDVGGAAMHLYCTGQGSPAIILDTGLGDDFTIWAKVQPALSKVTRVCSYDRAGFGWSESRSGARDANASAAELQLLAAAGIARPFVLMGHSIAGLHLRSYAMHYPGELAGLVFVDAATPLQDERVPRELVKIQQQQRKELPFQQVLMTLGWYRLRGLCTDVPAGMESYDAWIKADSCVPSQLSAIAGELDAVHASGTETLHAGPFGALPILVFSRDPTVAPPNWPADVAKANALVWTAMQEEAKSLSTDSRRIIAKHSDHYVHLDRPELVILEVSKFIDKIRTHDTPSPAASATTVQ